MYLKNSNGRIEFLKKREQEIRAQIAAERAKGQRRAEREAVLAAKIVGKAVIELAAQNPDGFGMMLKQVLNTAVDEKSRALLQRVGVL